MNAENLELAGGFITPAYARSARESKAQREGLVKTLLSQRHLPERGWDEGTVELVVQELGLMDSNNFVDNVGVGEREARVFSSLVNHRHFRMGHGIGRAGDVSAIQPKAAGSSLVVKLTQVLARDALRIAGLEEVKHLLLLPLATGMSMTLTLLVQRDLRPGARYVLWPRMDQKSCLKAILTSGLEAVVIENLMEGDEVRTDVEAIERKIEELGAENVLCVLTTSSCFAPRASDRVVDVAKLCARTSVPHIINNAYGIQCRTITKQLTSAMRKGRVDALVQSTDKNFMVPVGGAIVAGTHEIVDGINQAYPGRACMAPILDMFITLLSMGASGFRTLLQQREELFDYLRDHLAEIAERHGERLLSTPNNPVSMAITLGTFSHAPSLLGSMLFSRCVSGTRVVVPGRSKSVGLFTFGTYGAHTDSYPIPYMSCACAIGETRDEIDTFLARLDRTMTEFHKNKS